MVCPGRTAKPAVSWWATTSWAVLHPRTSLIAPFADRLAGELVWAIAGDDVALCRYINAWLARGQMEALFSHWVRIEG